MTESFMRPIGFSGFETKDDKSDCISHKLLSRLQITEAAKELAAQIDERSGESKLVLLVKLESPVEAIVSILAAKICGCIVVPCRSKDLPASYMKALTKACGEIQFSYSDELPCCIRTSVHLDGNPPPIEPLHPAGGALVLTSSGTTGDPKGIVVPIQSIQENSERAALALELRSQQLDYWVIDADLYFTSAICHVLMAWSAGLGFFSSRLLVAEDNFHVLKSLSFGYGGSPLSCLRTVEISKARDEPLPKIVVGSGDFFRSSIVKRIKAASASTAVYSFFGMTELAGRICFARLDDGANSVVVEKTGVPISGYKIEVKDPNGHAVINKVGEVFVSSDIKATGYLVDSCKFIPIPFAESFNTGDLGSISETGVLTLTGRQQDVFKVAGEQVNRNSIEKVLREEFAWADLVIFPWRDDILGFVPYLLISADPKMVIDGREIVFTVKKSLTPTHIPMKIFRTDREIPRTGSGKVKFRELDRVLQESTLVRCF